jgi:membrane peptidoglycan carboxypeptidase
MGKTGTTNEFKDALFIGSTYGPEGITWNRALTLACKVTRLFQPVMLTGRHRKQSSKGETMVIHQPAGRYTERICHPIGKKKRAKRRTRTITSEYVI